MNNILKGQLSVSMMCSNLQYLRELINIFEQEEIEYLHVDVMDGIFVPNLGFGTDYIRGLREMTRIPLDLHLMIQSPEYKFSWFGIRPEDMVSIHYESTSQVQRALDWLMPFRCQRFLAINPSTSIYVLEDVLDSIDGINLLMVNPGYAGQQIVPGMIRKAERLQYFLKERGCEDILLEVDGNITPERGAELRAYGANIFVAGYSSIFQGEIDGYARNIRRLRKTVS